MYERTLDALMASSSDLKPQLCTNSVKINPQKTLLAVLLNISSLFYVNNNFSVVLFFGLSLSGSFSLSLLAHENIEIRIMASMRITRWISMSANKRDIQLCEREKINIECLSIAVWFQNIILLIIIITCEIWIGCWLMVDYILCAHICLLYKCEIQLNANKTWDFFVECHANTQTHTSKATH